MDRESYFYQHLGPIVHQFIDRLNDHVHAVDDGNTKFLFCARGGIRILQLYKLYLEANDRDVPRHTDVFWVSRIMLAKGFASSHWDVVQPHLSRWYAHAGASGLVKGIFGTEHASQLSGVDFDNLRPVTAEDYLSAIGRGEQYTAFIREYLRSQGESYKEYLADTLGSCDQAVLIDTGWQATCQSILTHAQPDIRWIGFLVGRIRTEAFDPRIAANVGGLAFETESSRHGMGSFNPHRPITALSYHRHLIEHLFEPNGPSVENVKQRFRGYTVRGEKELLAEEFSADHDAGFLGVARYLKDHAKGAKPSEIAAAFDRAAKELAPRILFPESEDLEFLGEFDRPHDLGREGMAATLLPVRSRFEGDSRNRRIRDSLWSHGQIALEYQGIAARKMQAEHAGLFDRVGTSSDPGPDPDWVLGTAATPSVAIITRTKDRPVLLARAAASIAAQTFTNYVWVVVNDGGSVEDVLEILNGASVDRRKIKLLHNPESLGMEAASNLGISSCDSEYVVIHDDDDSWEPEFLAETLHFLQKDGKRYGGVITGTTRVSESFSGGEVEIRGTQPYNEWIRSVQIMDMACGNIFAPIAFLFRRSVYDSIGGYDESLPVLGDWDFNLRFLSDSDIGVLTTPLANYHHRDIDWHHTSNDPAYSNSLIGAVHLHQQYEAVVRNKLLRQMSAGEGSKATGTLVSLGLAMREIREGVRQIGNSSEAESRLREQLEAESESVTGAADEFDEEAYLSLYPDVRRGVESGQLQSGLAHYHSSGEAEGRAQPRKSSVNRDAEPESVESPIHSNIRWALSDRAEQERRSLADLGTTPHIRNPRFQSFRRLFRAARSRF